MRLPRWLSGKESACQAGDTGSVPALGRSPGEGNSYPFQFSGLENSMDYSPWNSPGQNSREKGKWVDFPFSRGSSQPREWTQASHIAGRFFTSWATKEVQVYWSGWPIPFPADLPHPGIEPGSPALQADSSPTELLGKSMISYNQWC